MSIPNEPVAVPERVRALARGDRLDVVWRNELGGLTFRATPRLGEGMRPDASHGARFIKLGPLDAESSVAAEVGRLEWARAFTPVPRVLEHGSDSEAEWLVTEAIPGESAVAPRWIAEPKTAVRAVGKGLRALHEALPVAECPFDWGVPARIDAAARRGIRVPDSLSTPPAVDRLVVCHGDSCCPNTLLDDDGRWVAHVDLGALGLADRWADIAVASMSTEWNYGPGWQDALIEAYGVDPDRERLAYYRELWNAT